MRPQGNLVELESGYDVAVVCASLDFLSGGHDTDTSYLRAVSVDCNMWLPGLLLGPTVDAARSKTVHHALGSSVNAIAQTLAEQSVPTGTIILDGTFTRKVLQTLQTISDSRHPKVKVPGMFRKQPVPLYLASMSRTLLDEYTSKRDKY